eukprot:TRINITY_DN5467_c0_g1_i3.p1 TRINITY_DN5467_c0_g1~~TRINITY_DN5467_c0_g1_i3.p1  ORF type:complete len:259 (+),score=45.88 TRINITY_DN5467_c0_g1_i3:74-778(+)
MECADVKTAVYHATHDHTGDMVAAINDMSAIDALTPEILQNILERHEGDLSMIVFDANISAPCINTICSFAHDKNIPVWFNPTSIYKSIKVVEANCLDKITFMSPNISELGALIKALGHDFNEEECKKADFMETALQIILDKGTKNVILTLSEEGLLLASQKERLRLPAPQVEIVNVTGAGDSLAAGIIHRLARKEDKSKITKEDLNFGILCAKMALECVAAVNPKLATLRQTV